MAVDHRARRHHLRRKIGVVVHPLVAYGGILGAALGFADPGYEIALYAHKTASAFVAIVDFRHHNGLVCGVSMISEPSGAKP